MSRQRKWCQHCTAHVCSSLCHCKTATGVQMDYLPQLVQKLRRPHMLAETFR
jgi:hypothetical protein